MKAKVNEFYQKIIKNKIFVTILDGCINLKAIWYPFIERVSGEKLSSDEFAMQQFMARFKEKVEEQRLLPEDIYNAEESGCSGECCLMKYFTRP